MSQEPTSPVRVVGRYALYNEIAAGGMATVHFGRLLGPVGFSRTVAIKRLHPQFAKDPEFVSMFLDEARLAARIRHPNVVPTLDVVATQGELFLVMDYVQGESLSKLIRTTSMESQRIPVRIVSGVMVGALHGLHAAHEAKNERGEPLNIVHRDISPQNILVGADGSARVLDFGVAKAAGRIQSTREGQLNGKLAYMAPEQITGAVTRQTDIYAAAIVLWESLTGRRLFSGDNEGAILSKVMSGIVDPPSRVAPGLTPELDAVVLRGLARDPTQRYATAREFALALERCTGVASATEIGEWCEARAHQTLSLRAERIAEIESSSANIQPGTLDDAMAAMNRAATLGPGNAVTAPAVSLAPRPAMAADPPISQSSQLSSISVSRTGDPQPPRRGAPWLWIGGVGAAVLLSASVLIAALLVFTNRQKPVALGDPSHATATAPASASPVASSSASDEGTFISTLPLSNADAGAKPAGTTSATGAHTAAHTGTAHPTTTAPQSATATATTSTPTTVTKPPSPNCDPPYTLDASGHKKWKSECM
ncbi:hypothetical protein BH09MYX1_BH09MYX1_17280 [soil metagenome]